MSKSIHILITKQTSKLKGQCTYNNLSSKLNYNVPLFRFLSSFDIYIEMTVYIYVSVTSECTYRSYRILTS